MNAAMRHTLFAVSLSLPMLSLTVHAQEALPRVLFCTGPCFAVDASGARTPVSKGTQISAGQRVETGPGAYAQLKLGRVGLGLAENTRVRFEPGTIALDQGRLRAVTGMGTFPGVATGLPQIRTPDGDLTLANGDIEIKRSTTPGTLVKVNAGDATLRSSAGEFKLPTEGIQSIQAGRLSIAPPTIGREMVLAPVRRETPVGVPTPLANTVQRPVLTANFTPVRAPVITPPSPMIPPLVTRVMNTQLVDTASGTTARLTDFVRTTALTTAPTTTLTTTKGVAPTTTTPTLTPRTGRSFVIR